MYSYVSSSTIKFTFRPAVYGGQIEDLYHHTPRRLAIYPLLFHIPAVPSGGSCRVARLGILSRGGRLFLSEALLSVPVPSAGCLRASAGLSRRQIQPPPRLPRERGWVWASTCPTGSVVGLWRLFQPTACCRRLCLSGPKLGPRRITHCPRDHVESNTPAGYVHFQRGGGPHAPLRSGL